MPGRAEAPKRDREWRVTMPSRHVSGARVDRKACLLPRTVHAHQLPIPPQQLTVHSPFRQNAHARVARRRKIMLQGTPGIGRVTREVTRQRCHARGLVCGCGPTRWYPNQILLLLHNEVISSNNTDVTDANELPTMARSQSSRHLPAELPTRDSLVSPRPGKGGNLCSANVFLLGFTSRPPHEEKCSTMESEPKEQFFNPSPSNLPHKL